MLHISRNQHFFVSDDNVYDVLKDAKEFNEEELVQKCEQHLIARCKSTDNPLIHGCNSKICFISVTKESYAMVGMWFWLVIWNDVIIQCFRGVTYEDFSEEIYHYL